MLEDLKYELDTVGMPCFKPILRSLKDDSQIIKCEKVFFSILEREGMDSDCFLDATRTYLNNKWPTFKSNFNQYDSDKYSSLSEYVLSLSEIRTPQNCTIFYRKYQINRNACLACKAFPYYSNEKIEVEHSILKYMLTSPECLQEVIALKPESFVGVIDVASELNVDKTYYCPVNQWFYYLFTQCQTTLFFDQISFVELFRANFKTIAYLKNSHSVFTKIPSTISDKENWMEILVDKEMSFINGAEIITDVRQVIEEYNDYIKQRDEAYHNWQFAEKIGKVAGYGPAFKNTDAAPILAPCDDIISVNSIPECIIDNTIMPERISISASDEPNSAFDVTVSLKNKIINNNMLNTSRIIKETSLNAMEPLALALIDTNEQNVLENDNLITPSEDSVKCDSISEQEDESTNNSENESISETSNESANESASDSADESTSESVQAKINEIPIMTIKEPYLIVNDKSQLIKIRPDNLELSLFVQSCASQIATEIAILDKELVLIVYAAGKYYYADFKEEPVNNTLKTIFLSKQVLKICYNPYLLYSILYTNKMPLKNVFSLVRRFGHLNKNKKSLSDLIAFYNTGSDFMASYSSIYKKLKDVNVSKEELLWDEVFGSSYLLSRTFKEKGVLFDMDSKFKNELYLNKHVLEDGYIITYKCNTIEPTILYLAEHGYFRKYHICLLAISNNFMTFYISASSFDYLDTVISTELLRLNNECIEVSYSYQTA